MSDNDGFVPFLRSLCSTHNVKFCAVCVECGTTIPLDARQLRSGAILVKPRPVSKPQKARRRRGGVLRQGRVTKNAGCFHRETTGILFSA